MSDNSFRTYLRMLITISLEDLVISKLENNLVSPRSLMRNWTLRYFLTLMISTYIFFLYNYFMLYVAKR